MATLCSRAGHYIFCPVVSFFFLLFPRLISTVGDWMSAILPRMVWSWCEFRMHVWNVLHAARWKRRTQKIAKNSPPPHHRTTLSGCILATKAYIDNRKKLVKQQYLLHMSSQYGERWPTNGSDWFTSFGTGAHFNGFCVLTALLHGTVVMGVSQALRRWTEGATYIWQGSHHVGHWPTF